MVESIDQAGPGNYPKVIDPKPVWLSGFIFVGPGCIQGGAGLYSRRGWVVFKVHEVWIQVWIQ